MAGRIIVSPVRRVEREVLGDLALPAVAVREQPLLVEIELLARFGRELEIRTFDDGVDRTGFLAEPAIDAFHHVDVVARRAPRAVVAAGTGLDGDGLRRADRLAQLAGDAALLAVGVAAQRMLAAEARRDRPLLEGIVERGLGLEEIAQAEHEGRQKFLQEQCAGGVVQPHGAILSGTARAISLSPRPCRRASSRCRRTSRCRRPAPPAAARTFRARAARARLRSRTARGPGSRARAPPPAGHRRRPQRPCRRSLRGARTATDRSCRLPIISAPVPRIARRPRRSRPWRATAAGTPSSRAA